MLKFKSVISKYLTAFILLTLAAVLLISSAAVLLVTSYSINAQSDNCERAVLAVEKFIESEYSYSDYNNFGNFIYYNREHITKNISLLVKYSDNTTIVISDVYGAILVIDSHGEINEPTDIPDELTEIITNVGKCNLVGNFGNTFASSQRICGETVLSKSKIPCGFVFVCSPFTVFTETVRKFITLTICICIAAVLIITTVAGFISKRISYPLNQINIAAKNFAAGKFDVRVPVIGHDEITELAIAFNNMAQSLENAEESRRNLLASVSHDLKTPMTTISGFIEGILDGAIPPEKQGYYLGIINDETQRLSRLVSQLLDITRIQAGERKFNIEPFDICEVARLILISLEQKIEDKKLDVEFNCDEDRIAVLADRDAIYQILYNLCHNAIKFSNDGGLLKISIMTKEQKCFISVYNTGAGIDKDELPFVFDRFYKSDKSRGLDKSGTGLGLFISKAIISAHNEEIWVKSESGKYCEFVFTLKRTLDAEALKRK